MTTGLYLDYLTNAEYLTHIAEPSYSVIISLINTVSQDIIRYILQYMFSNRESLDLSERTFRRLRTSIIDGNFEKFQFIFKNEYMQPNIHNWFEYDEESQGREWNFYPLCLCAHDCEPMKVHRHLYIHDCSCENGKRYLAFKLIYAEAYEILTISKFKSSKFKKSSKSNHKNNKFQKIADYIIESGPIILEHNSMTSTF